MERTRDSTPWLEVLYALDPPGRSGWSGPGAPEIRAALSDLTTVEDWRWIPRLVPLAFSPRTQVSAAARAVLERLLSRVPLARLPWLEKAIRRELKGEWNPGYQPGWSELHPDEVSTQAASLRAAGVAICSFHPSGWVRAEALRVLESRFPQQALPFLLLRLSDWVPIIRAEAAQRCDAAVAAGNEASWIRGLALLDLVERSSRARSPELRSKARTLLETASGRAAVRASLRDPDVLVRAFAYRRELEGESLTAEVIASALCDPELRIARLGAEALAPARFTAALLPALRSGLHSRLAYARRQCLDRLAETLGEEARQEIVAGLRDRSGLVRGVAQSHARRLNLVPALETFYVDLLRASSAPEIEVAITSLVELGKREAWPHIQPFLWARSGRLRSAALRAGVELSPSAVEPWLWEALAAPEPAVSRLGAGLLARAPIDASHLRRTVRLAMSAGRPESVRVNAVRLLASAGKWERAIAWLRIVSRGTASVRAVAHEELARWNRLFNRSFVRPTAADLFAFRKALTESEQLMSPGLYRDLAAALAAWATG